MIKNASVIEDQMSTTHQNPEHHQNLISFSLDYYHKLLKSE